MQIHAPIHWILQTDILGHVASFLPVNEVATTLRLVNKACARLLPSYVHVKLSRPVPHHAFVESWCSPSAMRLMSLRRRLQLLHLTAASGCLDNLQAALRTAGWDPSASIDFLGISDLLAAAAKAGHLHMCQWLQNHGCPWKGSLYAAAEAGQREVCEWMLAAGCPWDPQAIFGAAYGGHMELMVSFQWRYPAMLNPLELTHFIARIEPIMPVKVVPEVATHLRTLQLSLANYWPMEINVVVTPIAAWMSPHHQVA